MAHCLVIPTMAHCLAIYIMAHYPVLLHQLYGYILSNSSASQFK